MEWEVKYDSDPENDFLSGESWELDFEDLHKVLMHEEIVTKLNHLEDEVATGRGSKRREAQIKCY
ncbi:hypothetical protein BDZ91DRAFT_753815 [Kalaharituber pfeilii]|nr:hypothetical protein BDZ91DRAFT_753815 [Kalaharituber pfeilii]